MVLFLGDGNDKIVIRSAVFMKILQLVLARGASGNENANGKEEIHKVRCAACHTYPIRSDRYKCLNCENLDLCGQCFERRRESRQHSSGHVFVHFISPGELFGQAVPDSAITFENLKRSYERENHEAISCDGCRRESITGLRFKCDTCPRYDLCQECVDNGVTTKTHVSSHPLLVTPRRVIQQIPVEDIELGDQLGKGAFGK